MIARWLTLPEVQSLALVCVVFGIDLAIPLGVASAVPYTFAVLLALKSPRPWVAPTVAALCGILTFVKMALVPDRGTTELWKVIVNRFLALFSISMTLMLGLWRRRSETRRATVEEQLREHQASLAHLGRLSLLGQVAANMAHELNQPLTAVSLHAELAKRSADKSLPADSEICSQLQEIVKQSRRAADIVAGVRRLAKQSTQRYESLELTELVQTVLKLLEWQFKRDRVKVELDLPVAPVAYVVGDRILLEQVLVNLLQNAMDATADNPPDARHVTLRIVPQPDRHVVYVLDNGPGFADPTKMFEPFYTTKSNGVGLGLSFCRNIIDSHGGKLWANNRRQQGGAELGFWLPIPEEPE